jgi:hypothetical protein
MDSVDKVLNVFGVKYQSQSDSDYSYYAFLREQFYTWFILFLLVVGLLVINDFSTLTCHYLLMILGFLASFIFVGFLFNSDFCNPKSILIGIIPFALTGIVGWVEISRPDLLLARHSTINSANIESIKSTTSPDIYKINLGKENNYKVAGLQLSSGDVVTIKKYFFNEEKTQKAIEFICDSNSSCVETK